MKYEMTNRQSWYGGYHVPTLNPLHMNTARVIIARAEQDLGRLSPGQRRDLLKDNLIWPSAECDAIVAAIGVR